MYRYGVYMSNLITFQSILQSASDSIVIGKWNHTYTHTLEIGYDAHYKELKVTQEVCDGPASWEHLSWVSGWISSLLKNLLDWEMPRNIYEIVLFINT